MALTLLNLKSDWRDDQPYYTPTALYNKEFSIVNAPAEFFRRQPITTKAALTHELVFACLRLKALAVQDVLPMVQKFRANDWEPDTTHPALVPLRNPNLDNTFGDLMAFLLVCDDVFGLAYLEKIKNRLGGVIGLAPLDPRTVFERAKPGASIYPTYWDTTACYKLSDVDYYTIEEGSVSRSLRPTDVITIRANDVRSPLAGQSGVRAAFRGVGLDVNLSNYADAYLLAGGPSGLLKLKNKSLSPEEAEELQEQFARRHAVVTGRRPAKVAVLDEDAEYQAIGGHLGDLGSESLNQSAQAAICSAMGVPGQLVQALYAIRWGSQRAGQEAALKEFWELNLSPTLARYRTLLDKHFLSDFDGRDAGLTTRIFWDTSQVKALQEDVDKRASRYSNAYKDKAVSKNEYRAQLGLKPVPGGDYIPDDEEMAQQAQERLDQPQEDDPKNPNKPENLDDQKKSLKAKRKLIQEEIDQLPAIEAAQNDAKERLTAALLLIKAGLIQQGLAKLKELRDDFARLSLSLPIEAEQELLGEIEAAYRAGAASVNAITFTVDVPTILKIASVLSGALLTGVAARLVSGYAIRALRGKTGEEILPELLKEMTEESPAFYEGLASASGFQAIANGRGSEAERKRYKRAYYSALLDKNTCKICLRDDGKWSDKAEDLPPVPNPLCAGMWRCRCAHVYQWD
jgi:HK97 family phage portal protein